MDNKSKPFDILKFISILGVVILIFVTGAFFNYFYPKSMEFTNLKQRFHHYFSKQNEYLSNWHLTSNKNIGLIENTLAKKQQPYLAYYNKSDLTINLLSSNGNLVHQWKIQPKSLNARVPLKIIDYAYIGHGNIIVALADKSKATAIGYLVRLNKNSQVVWSNTLFSINQIKYDSNTKKIVVLTTFLYQPTDKSKRTIQNNLAVFNLSGIQIQSISFYQATQETKYTSLFDFLFNTDFKPVYTEATLVGFVNNDIHKALPFLTKGNLLAFYQTTNTLVSINVKSKKIDWLTIGPWFKLITLNLLNNGSLIVMQEGYSNLLHNSLLSINLKNNSIQKQLTFRNEEIESGVCINSINSDQFILTMKATGKFEILNNNLKPLWTYITPKQKEIKGKHYISKIGCAKAIKDWG